jgi:hypothetical protein
MTHHIQPAPARFLSLVVSRPDGRQPVGQGRRPSDRGLDRDSHAARGRPEAAMDDQLRGRHRDPDRRRSIHRNGAQVPPAVDNRLSRDGGTAVAWGAPGGRGP